MIKEIHFIILTKHLNQIELIHMKIYQLVIKIQQI